MEQVKRIPRMNVRFQPCIESREIAEYFKRMPMGSVVTYDELRKIAGGKDIQRSHRYILDTARKIAQEDGQIVVWPITGKGIKRLNDSEIGRTGETDRKFVNRKMKRSAKRMVCIDHGKLNEEEKIMVTSYTGLFLAVALVSEYQTVRKVHKIVQQENIPVLPPEKVLRLFA